MEETLQKIYDLLAVYGLKIVAALLILVIGRIIARIIAGIIRRLCAKRNLDDTVVAFLCNLTYIALMVFVVLAALGQLGVQTTSFIAVIGAAGLAVGLALQGSLANFAAGFLIIVFRPFKSGDFIEAAGTAGVVQEIGVFTSTLKTPDNKVIIVPNAKITGDNITNFTAEETRRCDLTLGVSYSDDLDKVRGVIQGLLDADDRILKDPEPAILVGELGDSSVNFKVRAWVKVPDYWGVYFDLTEKAKKAFDAEGISIPFPQRDVHLFEEKAG
jgi:small conductance mechanosensitive channel